MLYLNSLIGEYQWISPFLQAKNPFVIGRHELQVVAKGEHVIIHSVTVSQSQNKNLVYFHLEITNDCCLSNRDAYKDLLGEIAKEIN